MTKTEITCDQVLALLDAKYTLHYVDRDSNFDDHLDKLGKAIRGQTWEPIDESIDEWFVDDYFGMKSAIEELNDKIQDAFDLDEEEANEIIEKYEDDIDQTIQERDCSTLFKDLLRNTYNPVAFYDTDLYLGEPYSEQDVRDSLHAIKKLLKIKLKDTTHDAKLRDMIVNASYGGRLVVYFIPDDDDITGMIQVEGKNRVTFKNPTLAIIDTMNGSGGDTRLDDFEFTIPFDPSRVFFDKEIKYNYTYAVCGMVSTWCQSTKVSFSKKRVRKPVEKKVNTLAAEMEQERKYRETYEQGKCTYGDMDIRRHRNTIYQNTPPRCGDKCLDCGTFWID